MFLTFVSRSLIHFTLVLLPTYKKVKLELNLVKPRTDKYVDLDILAFRNEMNFVILTLLPWLVTF